VGGGGGGEGWSVSRENFWTCKQLASQGEVEKEGENAVASDLGRGECNSTCGQVGEFETEKKQQTEDTEKGSNGRVFLRLRGGGGTGLSVQGRLAFVGGGGGGIVKMTQIEGRVLKNFERKGVELK